MDIADVYALFGRVSRPAALLFVGSLGVGVAAVQNLNWDVQTGGFISPLAYTAASPTDGFGHPVVAGYFLNAGPVLANFHTSSITEAVGGGVEPGTAGLRPLRNSGFNLVPAKANLAKENPGQIAWLPAVSAGFVARTRDRNVKGLLPTPNKSYTNAISMRWLVRLSTGIHHAFPAYGKDQAGTGVTPDYIRVSVDIDDIQTELDQALRASQE